MVGSRGGAVLLRAVLSWLWGPSGLGGDLLLIEQRAFLPGSSWSTPESPGTGPHGQPEAASYSSKPWSDQLGLTRPPAHPRASTRGLGLGTTYSVAGTYIPLGHRPRVGDPQTLESRLGEDHPPTQEFGWRWTLDEDTVGGSSSGAA